MRAHEYKPGDRWPIRRECTHELEYRRACPLQGLARKLGSAEFPARIRVDFPRALTDRPPLGLTLTHIAHA